MNSQSASRAVAWLAKMELPVLKSRGLRWLDRAASTTFVIVRLLPQNQLSSQVDFANTKAQRPATDKIVAPTAPDFALTVVAAWTSQKAV